MIWSGVPQQVRARAGVAIIVHKKWRDKIKGCNWVNKRLLTIDLMTTRGHLEIVSVCAPEQGKREETERFYEQLQKTYDIINKKHHIIAVSYTHLDVYKRQDKI